MNRVRLGARKTGWTVVVTGGAGFIGSHTVETLLEEPDARVRVLDDLSTGQRANLPQSSRLSLTVGDVRDRSVLEELMQDADACLHLAAQVSVAQSLAEPVESASRNVLGFVSVLDAAVRSGLQRVVYASSAAVYGKPARLPLDEAAPTLPISPYGLEKLVDEQYADLFSRLHGLKTLGLRYFNVFGPRQDPNSPYSGVIARFLDCCARRTSPNVFGDGGQSRDFIHVRDVARANVQALATEVGGVVNVATGKACDLLGLIGLLGRLSGRDLKPTFQPAREGDIRESLGSAIALRERLGVTPKWSLEDGLGEMLGQQGMAA